MSAADQFSRAHEESRIALGWLNRLTSLLAERDPAVMQEALAAASLNPAQLAAHNRDPQSSSQDPIRLEQLDAAQLSAREHFPDITLRLYQASDLLDLGLIGYAIASSGTVRRAFELAIQYHSVTSDRYELELIETKSEVIVRQQPFIEHLPEYVDMGEEQAGIMKILEVVLGDQVEFSSVEAHFAYPAPDHADVYREVFPGRRQFEAEHTEIRFPLKWLDLPVATGNQSTSEVCASMCERVLGAGHLSRSTGEAVKRLLVSRVGREIYSLEEAASALRLSVSQLRKRLYREDTSYKQIVLEVRMTLARHYLEATSLSIQEIAYLLDYSQAAPFSRAFKSYFGYPPLLARNAA